MEPAPGTASPTRIAIEPATRMPTSCTTSDTPSTGARRDSQPPPKSPAPHEIAEASPRTTTADPGPNRSAVGGAFAFPLERFAGRGGGRLGRADIHGRGSLEGDDRVGRGVVAVRRRQVDHLEVPRDVPQQL